MEKSVMEEKCIRLLDLEAQIRRLRDYRPGEILTAKDASAALRQVLKNVGLSALGAFLLLKWVIPFVNGLPLQDWGWLLSKGAVLVLYIVVLSLGAFAVGSLIGVLFIFKDLVGEIKLLFTLKKRNAQVQQRNEQNALELQETEQAHEALLTELMDATMHIPHETDEKGHILLNFFFEWPFEPRATAKNLWCRNTDGETFKKEAGDWSCGCYGKLQFTTDKNNNPRMEGLNAEGIPCTPEMLEVLLRLPMLYMDEDLLKEALQNEPLLYILREIQYHRLTTRTTTTTTTNYDVDGALKKYGEAWDAYEAAVPGNNFGADVYARQSGEEALRNHVSSVSYSSSKDYLTGEQLYLLDKAYVVLYKEKLLCAFLPRGTVQKVSLAYKLDEEVLLEDIPGNYPSTEKLLKDKRFHGKLVDFQTARAVADNFSTIESLVKILSNRMLPQDMLEAQPEGVSGGEWRLWVTLRHQYRAKNYTR